jgi:ribosomal protein L21
MYAIKVLLLGGDRTEIGAPFVSGASVVCKVLNHDKNKKILVFHYKAKKNIRKRYGHRQPFTSLLIESIVKNGEPETDKTVKTAESEVKTAVEAEA